MCDGNRNVMFCRIVGEHFSINTDPKNCYELNLGTEYNYSSNRFSDLDEVLDTLLAWQHITLEDYLKILKLKELLNA